MVTLLGMRPHPEGGHYAEVYHSSTPVHPHHRNVERPALTQIYFLLAAGEHSRWHRVLSDEVWHYYEGDALELLRFDDEGLHRLRLGPVAQEQQPVAVIPADSWQAAHSLGAYTLVGCTVAPGFDLADFTLAVGWPEVAARIADAGPDLARYI